MPISLSNIKVTDGQNNLVITGNDITINGTSILGQNNFVTLDTTQTITGTKTFNNPVYCVNNNAYHHNMPGYTNGTVPSTDYYPNAMILNDSAGQYFGFYGPEMLKNGAYSVRMGVRSQVDNTKYSILKVGCFKDGTFFTSAPTPATSDNGPQIATTGWVNTVGNNVVHLTGDETIRGTKTLQDYNFVSKNTSADNKASSISAYTEHGLLITDKNNTRIGNFYGGQLKDGALRTYMCTCRPVDGTTQYRYVEVIQRNDGTAYFDMRSCENAYSRTRPVTSNDESIATTAYVNNKFQVVSALPSSPDSNTFYFIPA